MPLPAGQWPELPDFLKLAPEQRAAAWRKAPEPRQVRGAKQKYSMSLPREIEPAGLVLLREIEAQKRARQEARFAELRARRK